VAIQHFIVQGVHPLSTVEKPEFRNLIQTLQPGKTVMARDTLTKKFLMRQINTKWIQNQF
jgi:hypothetical protein